MSFCLLYLFYHKSSSSISLSIIIFSNLNRHPDPPLFKLELVFSPTKQIGTALSPVPKSAIKLTRLVGPAILEKMLHQFVLEEICGRIMAISHRMLGNSPALPLLTIEATALCSFSTHDVLSAAPNLKWSKRKYRGRLIIRPNIGRGKSQDTSRMLKRWQIPSVDQAQAAVVDGGENETWEESKQILTSLNFSIEEAEKTLKKAFGWVHSPYWSEERKKEAPSVEAVSEVLNYIRSLGLSDDDLHKLLKKFPEVLGCKLEDEVKLNVSKLDSEWGINGKSLRSLLLRNPKVLGYNVDCRGDCVAQCTRCWVRF